MNRLIGVSVIGTAALIGATALAVTELHRRPALIMGNTSTAPLGMENESTEQGMSGVYPSPPSAIGGGPQVTDDDDELAAKPNPRPLASANPAPSTEAPAASASPIASASGSSSAAPTVIVPAPTTPLAAPVFGAPPYETPNGVPIVGDPTPGDKPLFMGPSGGTPNPGVVNAKPQISARVLVPMSDTSLEGNWSTITPFLRGGDLLVTSAHGAGTSALAWTDRVRADAPLVAYAVAFDSPTNLEAALSKLPESLEIVGLSRSSDVDDKRLTDLSNKVHAAGRRFFVSTNLTGPSPTVLGSRADVVEISAPSGAAKAAADTMRTTGGAQVFVRVAAATPGNALATANASSTILKWMPDAGLALPYGDQVGRVLSDLRAPP